MDSVLLDTNVLLDFFEIPRAEHDISAALMVELAKGAIKICVAGTSLKDSYYILSKRIGKAQARHAVESILTTMTILPVDDACCRLAYACAEPDFEDGIIRAAAEIGHVDYLVTRDRSAFAGSVVPKISPRDLLREIHAAGPTWENR